MLDRYLPTSGLLDRAGERDVLERLVAAVRGGESRVLVLRGEAGIGKTVLLEHLSAAAEGCRIARAAGVESEMELPFAGLHALCAHMLGSLGQLPSPQRDALSTAFGLSDGPPPDRFLVGLAVLSLLADAAEEQPLLCIVDDAQWLDRVSAQTLAFVARRLLAERIGLVFALRESADEHELERLPELLIGGLAVDDARRLLDASVPGPLDARVRDRIIAEAGGNPLALLELPRGRKPIAVAGGFGLPAEVPLTSRIEQGFVRRVKSLPTETRRLLLLAAADPVGDGGLLWRAAELLGVGPDAAGPAETAGLVEIGARVTFRHPLVRSAAYRAAPVLERREVHRALADATDSRLDPDRRAWHRSNAAEGADEEVADELERSAGRAQARGGLAAAAAFLERASALTPDPARRGMRALAAAEAMLRAGAFETALGLLTIAEEAPLDVLPRARIDLLRAQIAFARQRDSDAPGLLLQAAQRLEPLDLRLARETHLDVLSATVFLGGSAGRGRALEMAQAAMAAPRHDSRRPSDLLLDGLATRFTQGYAAAAPLLRKAISTYPTGGGDTEETLRWMWLAGQAAVDLWEDQVWELLSNRYLELARRVGALAVLPFALNLRSGWHTFAGELARAASLADEAQTLVEATENRFPPYAGLMLVAWQGKEEQAIALIDATRRDVLARGEAYALAFADWATAVLYNGLGRPEEALPAAERASEHLEDPVISTWGLVELISAAFESGRSELAASALDRLSGIARASTTDWALGIRARSAALLDEGEVAESLYREAIERLGRTKVATELARAHLLYGEWLRRQGRSPDAREQLRTAREMFTRIGAEAFSERSERELLAAGERIRKSRAHTKEALTGQELQVARLAADGHTNPEIGAQLFISPRTVEYHLGKVFTKLDISSRKELRRALPVAERPALLA